MTSITHQAPISLFRAANETQLSQERVSQAETYANGANLQGTPLDFATPTDARCSIESTTVREAMEALEVIKRRASE
ncbi:hypothetical protein BH11PSE7_BH11PSE7_38440 [soil metagenome]